MKSRKENHSKTRKRFHLDKSCRFGRSCAYLHPDHYEKGNKKITKEIKEELENLEKTTKEEIDQLKITAKHQQTRTRLNPGYKCHPIKCMIYHYQPFRTVWDCLRPFKIILNLLGPSYTNLEICGPFSTL